MTQRENALRIIRRDKTPGWIPMASQAYDTMIPSAMLERPKGRAAGLDWFGCRWVFDAAIGGYAQDPRDGFQVDDITQWRGVVRFPDLDAIDWAACAEADLAPLDREAKLLRIFAESGPFERLHSLTSFEDAFIAMMTEPAAFLDMMSALTDFRVRLIDKLAAYYRPDVIFTMDDLGSQNAPLMSQETYRRFIKPFHRRISDAIHAHGMLYAQHSCGRMESFVGDLVDVGADIINPLQTCNDREAVLRRCGALVSFDCQLDNLIQRPDAGEEALRREVRRACDLFGPYGNMILHDACVVPENLRVIRDEMSRYGGTFYSR